MTDFPELHVCRKEAGDGDDREILGINSRPNAHRVEAILLSRNHPDVSLRLFHSIDHYRLEITRAALTGGDPLAPYLSAVNTSLFLSKAADDVQLAANQDIGAGLIYSPPPEMESAPAQIRIAFDGDCVLFSDEAQKMYDNEGLPAYYQHEKTNARGISGGCICRPEHLQYALSH